MTQIGRFTPIEQAPAAFEVHNTETRATRTKTQEGDVTIFRTQGEMLTRQGQTINTYESVRRTKTTILPNKNIQEDSEIQLTTLTEGQTRTSSFRTVSEYEILADSTRRMVKQTINGQEQVLAEQTFSVLTPDGTEYQSFLYDKPQDIHDGNGTFTILVNKQICKIQPSQ